MNHPVYWIALQTALGVHSKKLPVLLEFFEDAEGVFEADPEELKLCPTLTKKEVSALLARPFATAKAIWEECVASGITPMGPDHPLYPEGLRNIPDMPCVLYVKGNLPRFDRHLAISVIGTRKPTTYGKLVCGRVASVLAAAGVTVVSGGALGLDSVAHRSAIEAGGTTVAVLGCGINYDYLRENKTLRDTICEHGALVSEYPPRAPATRYTFPARNRLIAALSQGTVVIEAGEKSGTLITADYALEQGKDVFALPGSVMSPSFKGSNRLISQGATAIFSGLDVLQRYRQNYFNDLNLGRAAELHKKQIGEMLTIEEVPPPTDEMLAALGIPIPSEPKNLVKPTPKGLSEPAALVYNALLGEDGLPLHLLVERTQLETSALLRELTKLEMNGYITKDPAGNYNIEK